MSDPRNATVAELSATVNGKQYSAESLRFDIEINAVPTVKVGFVIPNSTQVKAPVSEETVARLAKLQAERLAGRTTPDLNVVAKDGIGGQLQFSGFIASPILQFGTSVTYDQLSGVGSDALLDALDMSIYTIRRDAQRDESGGAGSAGYDSPDAYLQAGDLIMALRAITESLLNSFDLAVSDVSSTIERELRHNKRDINESGPVGIWRNILARSDAKFESWKKTTEFSALTTQLKEYISQILRSPSPGFWNALHHLLGTFQLHYVPSFSGAGKLARIDTKTGTPTKEISLSVSSLSLSDGHPRILQPGGVVMRATGASTGRKESSAPSEADPDDLYREVPPDWVCAFYPNPLLSGFIQEEVPPLWLLDGQGVPVFGIEASDRANSPTPPASTKVDLGLERLRKANKVVRKDREQLQFVSEGILTEMCAIIFRDIQLASSSAVFTTPLDFTLHENLGQRVVINVLGNDGKPSGRMEAFVDGVTHQIDLRSGKALNTYSELKCTHVRFG